MALETNTCTCYFCGKEAALINAVEAGWIPCFYLRFPTKFSHTERGPACCKCAKANLVGPDENGEFVMRSDGFHATNQQ